MSRTIQQMQKFLCANLHYGAFGKMSQKSETYHFTVDGRTFTLSNVRDNAIIGIVNTILKNSKSKEVKVSHVDEKGLFDVTSVYTKVVYNDTRDMIKENTHRVSALYRWSDREYARRIPEIYERIQISQKRTVY